MKKIINRCQGAVGIRAATGGTGETAEGGSMGSGKNNMINGNSAMNGGNKRLDDRQIEEIFN